MKRLANPSYAIIAISSFLLLCAFQTPTELTDQMHEYYVSQFEYLELNEKGMFGTSRVEVSFIGTHLRSGGDPAYKSKDWGSGVAIYGNSGKPPSPERLELRYSRFPNGRAPKEGLTTGSIDRFVKQAVQTLGSSKKDRVELKQGATLLQARFIRLTKKECLGCHQGMNLNDPVALVLYRVWPKSDK